MKPFSAALIALGIAAAAPLLGLAQTLKQDQGAALLLMWDGNSDGIVTLAEVQTRRGDLFAAFDVNEDGVLAPEEVAQMDEMRTQHQDEMGKQEKGKGNGKGNGKGRGAGLDRAAFVDKSQDWLTRKDQNGDGVLTRADFAG